MDSNLENNLNSNNNDNIQPEEIYYSIDRFSGEFAVCENQTTGEFINIPKDLIDSSAKPGDIIKKQNDKYITDIEKTKAAKEEVKNLAASLFKRKNS